MGGWLINVGACVWFLSTFIGVNEINREPLQKALDALSWIANVNAMDYEYQRKARDSIKALEAELAKPEQAPFGYFYEINGTYTDFSNELPPDDGYDKGTLVPVYTAPRKEWVGLTDEEIKGILDCGRGGLIDIKKAEQTLKDKNT